MKIFNGKTVEYEPLKKKDIVILLRSLSGWSEEFLSVLGAAGIPAYADSRTGYFTAVEVETVLNMLALIDNPMQDIPLAAVLRSPIGGVTDEELAWMMAEEKKSARKGQDRGIYQAFCRKLGEIENIVGVENKQLLEKLKHFNQLLQNLRFASSYLPIHELLFLVYEKTGYYDYAASMPAGETRKANLDMLVEKASAYEKTSYKGLFQLY